MGCFLTARTSVLAPAAKKTAKRWYVKTSSIRRAYRRERGIDKTSDEVSDNSEIH